VRPAIEIVDAHGTVVRHLSGSYQTDDGTKYWVSNVAGYNRLAWDGTEDGPVRWTGTTLQNAGPLTGAEALPGAYTVALIVDGKRYEQPFTLTADPTSPWSADELAARHAYLARLFDDVSRIDVLLNAIDRQEKALRGARDAASVARRAQLEAMRAQLTADDRRDEDSTTKPDRLREEVFNALGPLGGSYQPPFAPDNETAGELQPRVESALNAAKSVLSK
jgi:hypothetical protein